MSAIITYLDHSGFAVSIDQHLLLFDYYNDTAQRRELASGVITRAELANYERISVFVSHGHSDHLNPVIFDWKDRAGIEYYVSSDVGSEYPGFRLSQGDVLERPGMTIHAFGSTDLGCSFLVTCADLCIFHAGDLNWWHWREQSTPMEIEQSEVDFKREMEPIIAQSKKTPIDIAFFPVDPRQKSFHDAGANYFILTTKPKLFVPMHCMGKAEVANEYVRRNKSTTTRVVALTTRGTQTTYPSI